MATTAFQRKAAAWVRRQYPGHEPVVGTVTFQTSVSSYGGETDADIDVTWTELPDYPVMKDMFGRELPRPVKTVVRTIENKAYDYDLNPLIEQIVNMEDPGEDQD